MSVIEKLDSVLEYLKALARHECRHQGDDFIPSECFGGNFDDAYWGGTEDGATDLARQLLTEFGVEWRTASATGEGEGHD